MKTSLAMMAMGFAHVLAGRAQTPSLDPGDLVRKTVQNELKSANESSNFMFRSRKETPHGSQTRLYVETREATAGLLIAINDKPLTREQRRAEEARLQNMVNNPAELKRKQKQEKEDADRISRIVRAMPDAFLYESDGTETGRPGIGRPGDALVRLKFCPNPKYQSPSRVEFVLTGMQGYVLIDANKWRFAQIDGTLYKDVSFGWGILGHLDRGGHFLVNQGDVGEGYWELTRMTLDLTGKILLFKSIVMKSTEVYSDFHPVPTNLTFAEGVQMLEKEWSTVVGKGDRSGQLLAAGCGGCRRGKPGLPPSSLTSAISQLHGSPAVRMVSLRTVSFSIKSSRTR